MTKTITSAAVAALVAAATDSSKTRKARLDSLFAAVTHPEFKSDELDVAAVKTEIENTKTERLAKEREYGIVDAIRDLLFAPVSHREIVDIVKTEFPGANTTIKSVATVAKVMRKAGVALPVRTITYG